MNTTERIEITGVVQGVGLRPFVYRLATALGLDGTVANDPAGVAVEVAGPVEAIAEFVRRLRDDAPPLAQIDGVARRPSRFAVGSGFRIVASRVAEGASTPVPPDTAVCDDCRAELFDPTNRRFRHPFITCTNCGPRSTIIRRLPYDRASTTMAGFALCAACAAEYGDPSDRRYHAQPIACHDCGPRLALLDGVGARVASGERALAGAVAVLRSGGVVAVKGLGGFHLACDASQPDSVARLRARKRRPHKPLALMCANLPSVARWAQLSAAEAASLESPERPIVLLGKQADFDSVLPGVAPGLDEVGMMLPYTPLQYLLFHEAAGRPAGIAWLADAQPLTLVMTSANPHGEPLVQGNDEAFERLGEIADVLLMHDRDIVVRCDDSVLRVRPDLPTGPGASSGGGIQFLRRARGFTPLSLPLTDVGPTVLAFGAHFKASVCIVRGREAFLSQHVGGLDNPAACAALDEAAAHLQTILAVRPEALAHDAHPDYYSTRAALALAERLEIPAIPVQHHHAHIAAVCAEHGIDEPVIGLAADGVGLGTDGMPWGGELLHVQGAVFRRLGHLSPLPLPGGDRAAHEPWRMACGVLHALGRRDEAIMRFAARPNVEQVLGMLLRGARCPPTTSLGRCFDAAAGLLGVCEVMTYEGQAAMLLEVLARRFGACLPLPGGYHIDSRVESGLSVLNLYPMLAQLADEDDAARGAARVRWGRSCGVDALKTRCPERESPEFYVFSPAASPQRSLSAAATWASNAATSPSALAFSSASLTRNSSDLSGPAASMAVANAS